MTDLEMTQRCAEKMGYMRRAEHLVPPRPSEAAIRVSEGKKASRWYDPLNDDKQAMALVKLFNLAICPLIDPGRWSAYIVGNDESQATDADLNRAIVECVSRMP